jgi:hypothetical protein
MTRNDHLRDAEANIDLVYKNGVLPTGDINTTRSVLCTVAEDMFRLWLTRNLTATASRVKMGQLVGHADRLKYSLRYALEIAEKRLPLTGAYGPVGMDQKPFGAAVSLLDLSADFATAVRLFSSHHSGQRPLHLDQATGVIRATADPRNEQYNTLEFLLNVDEPLFSPLGYVAEIFISDKKGMFHNGEMVSILMGIAHTAEVRQGRVRYKPDARITKRLFRTFNVPQTPRPQSWKFPWGSIEDCALFYAALQSVCAYHLLAVHFEAARNKLTGVGASQICFMPLRVALEKDITDIAGLSLARVREILEVMTLGHGVETSDPALQPLIPIGRDRLAVPSFNVLSSNWARNMLTLHARTERRTFNSQSGIFEVEMTRSMFSAIGTHFFKRPNAFLPTNRELEEIDIVIVDEQNRAILLCELRWILQPGDVREVINKRGEIQKKVAQIERKVKGVRAVLPKVLKTLDLPNGSWDVQGIIVIDGYGGLQSTKPKEFPIVPMKVAVEAINASKNLRHMHALLGTPIWLPRPNMDFSIKREAQNILGVQFEIPGINIGSTSYMDQSLSQYLAEAQLISEADLQSTSWTDSIP